MSYRATAVLVVIAVIASAGCGPGTAVSSRPQETSAVTGSSPVPSPGSVGEANPTPRPAASPTDEEQRTPEPSPDRAVASQCSNEAATVSDPAHRTQGVLRGDVDGDGRPEDVWLSIDRRAKTGCQVFLAVSSGSSTHSLAIVQPELNLASFPPALNVLAPIDARPGLEVVVDLVTGASTRFVGVFSTEPEALARVRFDGPSALPPGLFPYGGSVAHLDGVDCTRQQGTFVVSSASPRAKRFEIVRRFYRIALDGSTAVPLRSQRHTVDSAALSRYSELFSTPFAGCT
ncbi:MAG: hypothetical protein H0T12_01730 [Actinobacteria bacterium]|nr:hypothetical protein [Actinomycetota bacterium]